MTPVVVTPTELRKASESFKTQWQYAWNDMSSMFDMLKQCGGCAGTDRIGKNWSDEYDPVAQQAIDAATSYVIGLGQMRDLLEATASNHANANQLSVIGGAPDDLAFPPGSLEWMKRPDIPNLYGGDSGTPSWWDKISAYTQGEVWPNGNVDTLRNAATGWSYCAEQLATHLNFQPARDIIGDQQTPEVQQILDQVNLLDNQAKTLATQFMTLAHGCADYAQSIEDAHHKILRELAEFGATWVIGEGIIWLAATETFGLSVLGGNGALAARAAVVGSRVATIIRETALTAQATGLPVVAASGAFIRSVEELTPLLTSQASLLTAEYAGSVNPLSQTDLNLLSRRPYLRQSTKNAVNAAADKKIVNGQEFYVSATNSKILIPVSETYDDATILALPKPTQPPHNGQYYQAADGTLYPVESKAVYGHVTGEENWRLRDEALRGNPPMTWKEYSDFYNDPTHFRIEDKYGNSTHRDELPK
ncbi:GH-E family nuclease [Nocardia vinacea]|uniref:GH-E family nuclease n=1 Tax=Nocardia vinacea TaxID=96468 RepID=UPI0002D70115|nr:GH-E family nuclease [Nocardia vinacea]